MIIESHSHNNHIYTYLCSSKMEWRKKIVLFACWHTRVTFFFSIVDNISLDYGCRIGSTCHTETGKLRFFASSSIQIQTHKGLADLMHNVIVPTRTYISSRFPCIFPNKREYVYFVVSQQQISIKTLRTLLLLSMLESEKKNLRRIYINPVCEFVYDISIFFTFTCIYMFRRFGAPEENTLFCELFVTANSKPIIQQQQNNRAQEKNCDQMKICFSNFFPVRVYSIYDIIWAYWISMHVHASVFVSRLLRTSMRVQRGSLIVQEYS